MIKTRLLLLFLSLVISQSCFAGYLSTNTKAIPQRPRSPQSLFFVSLWDNCLRHIRLGMTLGVYHYYIDNPPDTTIRSVKVSFTYNPAIFPESWHSLPINVQGEQIDRAEINRSTRILIKALNKYPLAALSKDLHIIYMLKSMRFYDVEYGGTNGTDVLFLSNNGDNKGYSDLYLEQTFHHEYSSILYRNHPEWLDEKAWMAANSTGFEYNDPESGVGAIRNNTSSQDLDSILCKKGFLTQYSRSSLENDINTFAQNLFYPSADFWKLADKYPLTRKKMKLLVSFYHRIDPSFTEEYFRALSH
jgi:hypothetical protein